MAFDERIHLSRGIRCAERWRVDRWLLSSCDRDRFFGGLLRHDVPPNRLAG
nr:MAG TPA: hypothetical protein [Caudoviricetes sp.]